MQISVKVLGTSGSGGGGDVSLQVNPDDPVETIKAELCRRLQLPDQAEKKLLHKGKPLHGEGADNFAWVFADENATIVVDGVLLSSYHLTDGSKLHLLVKSAASGSKEASKEGCDKAVKASEESLRKILGQRLKRHLRSDDDVERVLDAFERVRTELDVVRLGKCNLFFFQIFQARLAALNLDDIESILTNYNEVGKLSF